jgi:hypothetical protein
LGWVKHLDPDLGSGSGIRIWDPDLGSGSGMNNLDNISESLKNNFWVKILKFFDTDPGWKKFGSGIQEGKNSDPGSKRNIRNTACKNNILRLSRRR